VDNTNLRVGGLIVAVLIVLGSLIWSVVVISGNPASTPEVQLGLVIVLAVFMLMALLFIMTAGFVQFKLADPNQALGLPEGTIRALISLILIMLFVIIGIYLFRTVGEGGVVTMRGMTGEQVTALGARVLTSTPVAGTNTFNVTVQSGLSDDGARLAQQLVTTIGTLVVAVAGFYFGTSATAAGASAAAAAEPLIIRSRSPLASATLNQAYTTKLEATGGTPPYAWTVVTGALPNGLTLDSASGQITGTPTAPGEPFSAQVEDKTDATAVKGFVLPVITPPAQ
jgi:hypothetical protein